METPKVTIHSAEPGAGAEKPASKPGVVVDAKGRRIVVRPIDALEEYRLAKIMGTTADSSRAWYLALQAASVREIEGEPEAFPNSDREIEAMIQRLGADGFDAVGKALVALGEAKPKPNKEAVKN